MPLTALHPRTWRRHALLLLAAALLTPILRAQSVTSGNVTLANGIVAVAGGGGTTPSSTDTTLSATGAQLGTPYNVAVDTSGNLYIADGSNNQIEKVSASTGYISVVAGGDSSGSTPSTSLTTLSATSAKLNNPFGVAVDASGNLYIADGSNNQIEQVNASTGYISVVAGGDSSGSTPGTSLTGLAATSAKLNRPEEVAVDASGNLYIADDGNNQIEEVSASTGYIIVVAGGDSSGSTPSTSLTTLSATSAQLSNPKGVALDAADNLYIADTNNGQIEKVSASTGYITVVAGGDISGSTPSTSLTTLSATSAALADPTGVTVDAAGNLYIADQHNFQVEKVSASTGYISVIAGAGGIMAFFPNGTEPSTTPEPATSASMTPFGVALDSAGDLYISDQYSNLIDKAATFATQPATAIGSASTTQTLYAELTSAATLSGITVSTDASGTAEFTLGTVTGCKTSGHNAAGTVCDIPVTFSPAYPGPRTGMITLADASTVVGTVGVNGLGKGAEAVMTPGSITATAGNGATTPVPTTASAGATSVGLNLPYSTAVDSAGNLYIADYSNDLVEKVTAGNIAVVAGGGSSVPTINSGPATSRILKLPSGVAVDAAGNLYIADSGHDRIDEVSPTTGDIVVIVGQGHTTPSTTPEPAASASLDDPSGVTVDASGNLYIADSGDNQIEEVYASNDEIVAVAGGVGNSGTTPTTTPRSATSATLSHPNSVAVDASDDLYIADNGNNLVEEVSAATGDIAVVAGGGATTPSTTPATATSAALNFPTGVALDPAGDLYIADSGNNLVEEVSAATGDIAAVAGGGSSGTSGDAIPSATAEDATNAILNYPYGVALDGAGNLYVADAANNLVETVSPATPTLSFPNTTVGNTSTAQTVTLADIGNEPLSINIPSSGNNPSIATNFTLNASPATTCPVVSSSGPAGSLAAGASCTLSVSFAPTTGGTASGALTITDNSDTSSSTTQSFDLSGSAGAGPLDKFVITGPNPAPFYTAFQITITAEDAYGNTEATFDGTATLTSSDPGFVNPGTVTFTNGVATPDIALKTAGVDSVTATDTADSSITGTADFTVNPGPAVNFGVSAPASAYLGGPASVTVTAYDLYGNVATGYTGTVGFTSTDTKATLPSNYTFTGGDAGAHVFSVTFGTVGSQTVTATDTTTSTITGTSGGTTVGIPNYVVETASDDASGVAGNCPAGGGGTSCTLRDALAAANAAGSGSIAFNPAAFATAQTITLANGPLALPANTTLTGTGTSLLTLDGDQVGNILQIGAGAAASVSNLTLEGGQGTGSQLGGAVDNAGTLTLSGVAVQNNTASGASGGGGIYNEASGALTLSNCTVADNSSSYFGGSSGYGGGLLNEGGSVSITACTFNGNAASESGGNLYSAGGTVTIVDSTVTGAAGTLNGGGIGIGGGAVTVTNSTISGNGASNAAGGIYVNGGAVTLGNTILAGNTDTAGTPDGSGVLTDHGYNLIGNDNGLGGIGGNGDLVGSAATPLSPQLAALGNYVGPTQTLLDEPGSPAICAGSASVASGAGITTDQRGVAIGAGGYCPAGAADIGAVQSDYALSFYTQPSAIAPATAIAASTNFQAAVTVTEDYATFTASSANVALALTTGAGTLSGGTAATSTGVAAFSSLQVNAAGSGDVLTASLALNPALTPAVTISAPSAAFNVSQAMPSLSFTPTLTSEPYGVAIPAAALNASASHGGAGVAGTFAYTTVVNGATVTLLPGTTVLPAGNYTITATFTPTDGSAYAGTSTTASYTVSQLPITVTASSPSIAYGQTLPTITGTVTSGALVGTDTLASIGITCSVAGSPANVGGYTTNCAGSPANYAATFVPGSLTITQATQTITFPAIPNQEYSAGSVTLDATASSGLPVTFTVVSGPATVLGSKLTFTGVGTVVVDANQAGNANYQAAPQQQQSFQVLGVGAMLSQSSLGFGHQIEGSSSAAQTVMLENTGGAALAIGSITVSGNFTETNTCGASLAAGASCAIAVVFTPQATGALAGTLTVADSASTPQQTASLSGTGTTYTLTLSSGSGTTQTVNAGASASYTLSLEPQGYTGTVTLSCAVIPSGGPGCAVTPNPATASGSGTIPVTVTLTTTARSLAPPPAGGRPPRWPWLLLFAVLPLAAWLRRRVSRRWLLAAVAGTALLAAGCASHVNNLLNAGGGTPPGTYQVQVTAQAGSATRSVSLELTVY